MKTATKKLTGQTLFNKRMALMEKWSKEPPVVRELCKNPFNITPRKKKLV